MWPGTTGWLFASGVAYLAGQPKGLSLFCPRIAHACPCPLPPCPRPPVPPFPPHAARPEPYLKGTSCCCCQSRPAGVSFLSALVSGLSIVFQFLSLPRARVPPKWNRSAPESGPAPPKLRNGRLTNPVLSANLASTRTGAHASASTTIRPPIRPSPHHPPVVQVNDQQPDFQPANLPRSLVIYQHIAPSHCHLPSQPLLLPLHSLADSPSCSLSTCFQPSLPRSPLLPWLCLLET